MGIWKRMLIPSDSKSFALVSKIIYDLGSSVIQEFMGLRKENTVITNIDHWCRNGDFVELPGNDLANFSKGHSDRSSH